MQTRIVRLLNVGGFIAPVLWVAAFLYSGSLRPEYSHYRQYVSELAARGTPTQHFMQVTGFVIPGLLIAGFGYFLGMPARAWLVAVAASLLIVSGIAKAVAGLFPLDPCCTSAPPSTAQEIHNDQDDISFQDMQSTRRVFSKNLAVDLGRDENANDVILGQASRHVMAHAAEKSTIGS